MSYRVHVRQHELGQTYTMAELSAKPAAVAATGSGLYPYTPRWTPAKETDRGLALPEFKLCAFALNAVDDADGLGAQLVTLLDEAADDYGIYDFYLGVRVAPFAEKFTQNGTRGIAYVMMGALVALESIHGSGPATRTELHQVYRDRTRSWQLASDIGRPIDMLQRHELREWISPAAVRKNDCADALVALRDLVRATNKLHELGWPVSIDHSYTMNEIAKRVSVRIPIHDLMQAGVEFDREILPDGPHTFPKR